MTPQEVLFIVSIVFFVLAVVFIGLAVFIFFARNVPDVRADLSGKKRAEGIAQIGGQRPGRDRHRAAIRNDAPSGALAESILEGGSIRKAEPTKSSSVPQPQQQAEAPVRGVAQSVQAVQPEASNSDDSATTILPDDSSATSVLEDDANPTTILTVGSDSVAGAPSDSASSTQFGSDATTTALPAEEPQPAALETATALESAGAVVEQTSAPAGFKVVRKIVLRESNEVVNPAGDAYA